MLSHAVRGLLPFLLLREAPARAVVPERVGAHLQRAFGRDVSAMKSLADPAHRCRGSRLSGREGALYVIRAERQGDIGRGGGRRAGC